MGTRVEREERAMENGPVTGVVVGTDGTERGTRAVQYAAVEARRLGAPLTVAHVAPDYVPLAPMRPLIPDDLRDVGRSILTDARRAVAEVTPDLPVRTVLETGAVVPELVRLARDARLLVLGHESSSPLTRVFTGAVTMGVAAHAGCPVVSVPDAWLPRPDRGRVLVGYKDAGHDADLLARAFSTAASRDATLTILHAWELPGCYDDIIVRRTHDDDWNRAARDSIEGHVADLRAAHPDLEVEVRVEHDQPAHALRKASAYADLLLLARRRHGPAGLHLGGTARALLRVAACPVELVPPPDAAPDLAGLELERAGVPQK
jgi:nucleotide-binding universal stress UspA family protein